MLGSTSDYTQVLDDHNDDGVDNEEQEQKDDDDTLVPKPALQI